ncbi:hypothetical protein AUP68_11165 [Ilyonectria robusta]
MGPRGPTTVPALARALMMQGGPPQHNSLKYLSISSKQVPADQLRARAIHIRPAPTIGERHARACTRLYINLHTFPKTHPLAGLKTSSSRRYMSPMKKLALAHEGNTVERMETIQAYTLPPWHSRLPIGYDRDRDMAMETASRMEGILVATSASEKAGRVGMGGIVRDTLGNRPGQVVARYSITIGSRDDQNVYTAELEAIAMALRCRARSRTPALPGPYDEVVEVEDSPPHPVSPASQLMRDRPKPVSSSGIGYAQLLPNTVPVSNGVTANTRARLYPSKPASDTPYPQLMAIASAASQAIQNTKGSTRKPKRQRTGYQWVHISLLLVSLETRYFNGLAIEVPETVLPLKDTVIKFSSADLLTWSSFTQALFEHLRPLPSTIDPTNRELWNLSYASYFSGKKIVTVPNTDKYTTPSSMLASGHFSNNQAGQVKVLVVLTSTDVVDKQEPITPLKPDEYLTPVRKDKKRKVKQEDSSPAPEPKKRIKQERQIKKENGAKNGRQVKQENAVPASSYSNPAVDEDSTIVDNIVVKVDAADPSGLEDPVDDLVFDSVSDEEEDEREADQGYEIEHGNDASLLREFQINLQSAVAPESIEQAPTQQVEDSAVEGIPPAHSTRFRGTKIPMTFVSRPRKRRD